MNGARAASNKHARTTARRFALADECSVTVAGERLYYKFFAEPKPACSITCATLTLFTYKEPVVEHSGHFAACPGLDWSDAKHDICLVDTATGSRELSSIRHTPAALDEWACSLRARFGGRRVAVCLEQSRGPLIYALLKYDFLVLYPVNPKTLARFREAFPRVGRRTTRPTPPTWSNCCCIIETASRLGRLTTNARARCNCWSSIAAGWWATRRASATG